MKTIKLGKAIAIAVLTLGVIHNITTFTPIFKAPLAALPEEEQNSMVYISLMCGFSFIISGAMLILLLNKLDAYSFLINPVIVIGIFLALSAIALVIFSSSFIKNPFAWIAILVNLAMATVIAILTIKKKRKTTRWYNCL